MSIESLKKHNFQFNKSFGQNFIFDNNFLQSIVKLTVEQGSNVLEIGAGAGTLTAQIAKLAGKVLAFEIDRKLEPILSENLQAYTNVNVIYDDIMSWSMTDIESHFDGQYSIVANLPYYITTPIIFKFIENATRLKSMSIMVQLEVANRIVAKPSTKQYGAITPSIDYRANAKIVKRVNRNMFTPVPNVDSAIVKIDFVQDKYDIADRKILDNTIKSVFAMRRKTIENNLKSTFALSPDIIDKVLLEANIDKRLRGEVLTTAQLVTLSNVLSTYLS